MDFELPNIRSDGDEGPSSVGTNRQDDGNKTFKKWLDELVEKLSHSSTWLRSWISLRSGHQNGPPK